MARTSIGLEPNQFQKISLWQHQDVASCKRTADLPYEIVYSRRMGPSARMTSSLNVRSVLDITDTLEEAFRIAITRIQEIQQRVVAGESPYTLQIWHYGQLLALARLSRDESVGSPSGTEQHECPPLHVHWLRDPTTAQISKWNVDLDMAMSFSGHSQGIEEIVFGENARDILMDLLLIEHYVASTKDTFKVLYKVERAMGSSQGISTHLENDLGMRKKSLAN